MPHEIVVPRLGWSMEEGTFVGWLKRDGDAVRPGDPLFELEGEKAAQEIEAVDAGILRIPPNGPAPGDTVKVGAIVGHLLGEGESPPASGSPVLSSPSPSIDPPGAAVDKPVASEPHRAATEGTTAVASPRARRVALELGVDWTALKGTGARGRIRESDVREAASAGSTPRTTKRGRRVPITARRRVIAQRMAASRQQTAPVTLTTRADATNLVALRDRLKSAGGAAPVPTYQDIMVKLVADSLRRHPLLAGRWDDDAIEIPADDGFHIGIAVDTEEGLLVPVLRDVCGLSLNDISSTSRRLVEQARAGRLPAAEMQGAFFTITNLGAFGIDAFTPVINLPETAILGLGAIRLEPAALDDGRIVARHQVTLSLTFDHRILDGAPAARFLQDLTEAITDPAARLFP